MASTDGAQHCSTQNSGGHALLKRNFSRELMPFRGFMAEERNAEGESF